MSSKRTNKIEVLSEWLEFLQITEKASSEYKQTNTEMSVAPAPAMNKNVQVVIPKSMIPDLGWFNRNQTKFEDW